MMGTPAMDRRRRAFTLLELIVVLGIISLLAVLIAPRVVGRLGEAKPVVTRQQISNAVGAIELFRVDVGRYPTTEEGLKALSERPSAVEEAKWKGPYLGRKTTPKDGWGKELRYRAPAQSEGAKDLAFEVYSLGADDQPGGEGENADIFHWAE
jgi:general secretion pathway protein G